MLSAVYIFVPDIHCIINLPRKNFKSCVFWFAIKFRGFLVKLAQKSCSENFVLFAYPGNSLREFGKVISAVEDERDRMVGNHGYPANKHMPAHFSAKN